jgi:CBS domain-containing membrane protein
VAAATVAIAASIAAMVALRCLHPPSGAIALTAVMGGDAIRDAGYWFIADPVALNSVLILLVAIVYNNATRRRYPHPPQLEHATTHLTADRRPSDRLGFTPDDLDDVLKQYNQVLDVSRDDLESLFLAAEKHAFRRRHGEITCADIMSRDIVTVRAATALSDAWALLRRHRVKALPVVDEAQRVVGILTLVDFMTHARLDGWETFDTKLRMLLRGFRNVVEKPRTVGEIMTTQVRKAGTATHIVELVSSLSDEGMHHIPVVDHEQKLVGIVTQSDIIAALYRGQLADQSLAA